MVCNHFGDDSMLLLCDGCDQSCHVFCAGLDSVPTGAWFCYDCQADPQVWNPQTARSSNIDRRARAERRGENRGRGQRSRNFAGDTRTTWARVWHSVAHATDIDLEFPFAEEASTGTQRSEAAQQEFRDWQRRFRVAARAAGPGAANRFRNIAPLNQTHSAPDPESQEEIKAWNAFEKARIVLEHKEAEEDDRKHALGSSRKTSTAEAAAGLSLGEDHRDAGQRMTTELPRTRPNNKRSRPSSVDVEERPVEVSRKRKRPRTLRAQEGDLVTEPTRSVNTQEPPRAANRTLFISAPVATRADASAGPTFLQSLLEEVDHVAINRDSMFYDVNGEFFPYGTEGSLSLESPSPPVSGQATPRSMTPPPTYRPTSPVQPSSLISPIFPPAPDLSDMAPHAHSLERARSRQRAHLLPRSPESSPTRSEQTRRPTSPTSPAAVASNRNNLLGIKTKTEVQNFVKSLLKPFYKKKIVNTEQYTEINMNTCRKTYEVIGTEDSFATSEHWKSYAKEEVDRAIGSFKQAPILDAEPPKPSQKQETDTKSKVFAAAALPMR